MMSPRVRVVLLGLIVPVLLVLGILGLRLVGDFFARAQVASSQATALNIIQKRQAEIGVLEWEKDPPNLPRSMEPRVRDDLTSDYRLAFEELTYAMFSGDATGIKTYFQSAALHDVKLSTQTKNTLFVDWDHQLQLHFYAPDGSTVAFTDTYLYAQGLKGKEGLSGVRIARRVQDLVMKLDDGNWRIHLWEVTQDQEERLEAQLSQKQETLLKGLRGVVLNSAETFPDWPQLNPRTLPEDLQKARDLGVNAVVVRVPYPLTLTVTQELGPALDTAQKAGLKVVLSVLEGFDVNDLSLLPQISRDLQGLQLSLSHPNVAAIVLSVQAGGHPDVLAHLLSLVRGLSKKAVGLHEAVPEEALSYAGWQWLKNPVSGTVLTVQELSSTSALLKLSTADRQAKDLEKQLKAAKNNPWLISSLYDEGRSGNGLYDATGKLKPAGVVVQKLLK